MLSLLLLIIGFALIVKSAAYLIESAGVLAKFAGISPLIIGLTIVAYGTSAPELFVNLTSNLRGVSDIALGNIIGASTADLLLVGGLMAIIKPIKVEHSTLWREIPMSIAGIFLVGALANDYWLADAPATLSRIDGAILLAAFAGFFTYVYRHNHHALPLPIDPPPMHSRRNAILILAGALAGLAIGANLVVANAVNIAALLGVTNTFVGLTIVTLGTTLPELSTTLIASYRQKSDLALGNIIGTITFNILFILGLSALIHPISYHSIFNIDLLVLLGATMVFFMAMHWREQHIISRAMGIGFVLVYVLYIIATTARLPHT